MPVSVAIGASTISAEIAFRGDIQKDAAETVWEAVSRLWTTPSVRRVVTFVRRTPPSGGASLRAYPARALFGDPMADLDKDQFGDEEENTI